VAEENLQNVQRSLKLKHHSILKGSGRKSIEINKRNTNFETNIKDESKNISNC